jgi:hypothetical protein
MQTVLKEKASQIKRQAQTNVGDQNSPRAKTLKHMSLYSLFFGRNQRLRFD